MNHNPRATKAAGPTTTRWGLAGLFREVFVCGLFIQWVGVMGCFASPPSRGEGRGKVGASRTAAVRTVARRQRLVEAAAGRSTAASTVGSGGMRAAARVWHGPRAAWNHASATAETRKRILRGVLIEIAAHPECAEVHRVHHWQGGDHCELTVR